MVEYCTQYNITRKDKQGNIVTSLGSGIVAYLKSQLLGDLPRTISDRPTNGLTREEVLDLIAESITSNTPIVGGSGAFALAIAPLAENRSSNPIEAEVAHRLDTSFQGRDFCGGKSFANANEQQLSLSTGISRDEVEQLIQVSEQRVLDATRSLWAELWVDLEKVKTIENQVNIPQIKVSTNSQDKSIADTVKSPATDTEAICDTPDRKPLTKGIKRWLEPLNDRSFRDVIQTGISEKWSNQKIVAKLFEVGYGKDKNTQPYPTDLASAMKTAFLLLNNQNKS